MSAVIFNGAYVKALKDQFKLADTAYILTGTDSPAVVAKDAPKGSLYIRTGSSGGQLFVKQDSGSSTSWTLTGTIVALTPTAIPFADGSGNLTQDVANLYYDDAQNTLHIANVAIGHNLDVDGLITADGGIDVTATGGSDTLAIGTSNADIINIGSPTATVNIQGAINNVTSTNLNVTDALITINDGGGAGSGSGAGFEVEEAGSPTGYVKVNGARTAFSIKAPGTAGVADIVPGSSGITLNQSSHDPLTLAAVDASPNANGASLSGQQLTLQPADGSNPGVLTASAQSIGGVKTFNTNTIHSSFAELAAISTPSAPSSGHQRLYATTVAGQDALGIKAPTGQELIVAQDLSSPVKNTTGSTLTVGQAIILTGTSSGVPLVSLAKADLPTTADVYGVVSGSSISDGSIGAVATHGRLTRVDTSGFTAGDTLYLSASTAGALTNSAPAYPNALTTIGIVLVSDATNGVILLDINHQQPTTVAESTVPFYFSPTASTDISGYGQLITSPSTSTETIFTGTGTSGVKTLIKAFATEVGSPSVVTIPSGTWVPRIYASVASATGTNTLTVDVYKRASGGTETLLYSVTTPALTTTPTLYDLSTAQGPFTLVSTDRLVFKVSYTASNAARVTSFYTAGNLRASYINSPLTARIGVELQANKNTPNGYAGLDGSTLITTALLPVVPVAKGGTNSSTSLNNNRVMVSSGGAIVEASAITASKALASDSNGIPVATSVTTTELGYVSGVTSAIQTQLNSKVAGVTDDIAPTSFSAADNQGSAANVTGLAFSSSTVRAFEALVSVYINATTPKYESFKLHGINKGSSFEMSQTAVGDTSGFVFSITSGGQVQYTSPASAGFVSAAVRFRAGVLAV